MQHHRLLQLGHSHRRAVLLVYLWAAVLACGAVALALVDETPGEPSATPGGAWTRVGAAHIPPRQSAPERVRRSVEPDNCQGTVSVPGRPGDRHLTLPAQHLLADHTERRFREVPAPVVRLIAEDRDGYEPRQDAQE